MLLYDKDLTEYLDFRLHEEKVALSKHVMEVVRKDAQEFLSIMDRIKSSPVDLDRELEEFLYKQELLHNGKYIIDGKVFDYEEELIDYFDNYEEACEELLEDIDPWEDGFYSLEKEQLEALRDRYDAYVLYARFLKWQWSKDINDLSLLIEEIKENYAEGFMYPVDPEEFWKDEYTQFSDLKKVDQSLVEWVINVQRFYDVYAEYMRMYMDQASAKDRFTLSYEQDVIYDNDCIEEKSRHIYDGGLYDPIFMWFVKEHPEQKMELWRRYFNYEDFFEKYCKIHGIEKDDSCEHRELTESEKEVVSLLMDSDRKKELWKACEPTRSEYYELTRNLTDEEKIKTGRCACMMVMQNIEAIAFTVILLKELSKEEHEYEDLYKSMHKLHRRFVHILFDDEIDYEDQAVSTDLVENIGYCRTQYLVEINARTLSAVASDDIEQLLQCKNLILPMCSRYVPWLMERVENSINTIVEHIKTLVALKEGFPAINKAIQERFGGVLSADTITTLATAEYLYTIYVKGREAVEDFDYSFISIMYYKVLEGTLNEYVYKKYLAAVRDRITESNIEEFFGESHCVSVDENTKNLVFFEEITLGGMAHLMKMFKDENSNLSRFVSAEYPGVDIASLGKMQRAMFNASDKRNNASHPGTTPYDRVQIDKDTVYHDDSFGQAKKDRDLFVKTMRALGLPLADQAVM